MKNWDRFAHSGVKKHLRALKIALENLGGYQFGSSGEGEITARNNSITAYARKYKVKNGWRLVICKGSKVIKTLGLESQEAVIRAISTVDG